MYDLFENWSPETTRWLAETLVNIMGFAIGAAVVIFQIGKQLRHSQLLQVKGKKNDQKLKIYENILDSSSEAYTEITGAFTSLIRHAVINEPMEFSSKHFKAELAVDNLLGEIKKYRIVAQSLGILGIAFEKQLNKVRKLSEAIFANIISEIYAKKSDD